MEAASAGFRHANNGLTRPHPAAIGRNLAKISSHLASHTLPAVLFRQPHVLVALQPDCWPGCLYMLVHWVRWGAGQERRFSGLPEDAEPVPVVVLRAVAPTPQEWGGLGHMGSVFFVKGNFCYDLDLLRAGAMTASECWSPWKAPQKAR